MTSCIGKQVEHLLHLPLAFSIGIIIFITLIHGMKIIVGILSMDRRMPKIIHAFVFYALQQESGQCLPVVRGKVFPYVSENTTHDVTTRLFIFQKLKCVII